MTDELEGTGDEELEGSADAVVTQADLDALEDTDRGTVADDAPTENKWNARRSLSELLEEDDAAKAKPAAAAGKKPAAPTGKAEGAKGDVDVDDEEDLDDDDDDELEEPKRDAKKDEPAADDKKKGESGKPRYSVKGADGKAFAFELQPGTSIQFQGDGKPVEVKSIDELVQLAQKGVAFDRKTSEQGQQIATLKTSAEKLQGIVKTTRESAEATLMAALFDREARQKLRVALAPYRDPEYRKGVEAQQKLAEQEKEGKATEEQQVEEKRTEFWTAVGSDIRLEIGKTANLTADDAMEVATRFHLGYQRSYEAKFSELTAAGVDEATANQQANTHAFNYFTEKNLRRVIRGLDAELAEERKGKKPAADKEKPRDKAAADKATQAHNRKLDDKLAQRRRSPRLQGGGAVPGARSGGRAPTDAPAKPRTFAQRMDGAYGLLRGED